MPLKEIDSHNTFKNPEEVVLQDFEGFKVIKGVISLELPAHSVIMLEIQ